MAQYTGEKSAKSAGRHLSRCHHELAVTHFPAPDKIANGQIPWRIRHNHLGELVPQQRAVGCSFKRVATGQQMPVEMPKVARPRHRYLIFGGRLDIASIAGKEGVPRISAYSAAKAGVIGFTKSIARELAETGVLANCIAPVITETELFKEMTAEHIAAMKGRIPMGRFLTISEIAAVVAFAASPECSFTTGFTFDVSGGRTTY